MNETVPVNLNEGCGCTDGNFKKKSHRHRASQTILKRFGGAPILHYQDQPPIVPLQPERPHDKRRVQIMGGLVFVLKLPDV